MVYQTLVRDLKQHAAERARQARRARVEAAVALPIAIGVILAYRYREELFGTDVPVRVAAAMVLVALGWAIARDLGRAVAPALMRRMDPGTAGTIGFLIRLFALGLTILVALRIAGLRPETLAIGGAITAVIFGLAAQQTFGHLVAGAVLLSARPFRVGQLVRLRAGAIGGEVEGMVASLGLLYTTLDSEEGQILIPNSLALSAAVVTPVSPRGSSTSDADPADAKTGPAKLPT